MSQHFSSSSSYHSVIPHYEVEWPKLDCTDELTRLHYRFWGKPLRNHCDFQLISMTVDVDKEENKDNNIKSGNCILDVGISGKGRRIYVRKEYICFYELCKKHMAADNESSQAHSVIITGQPGIGKTCWVFYALCQCLSEKRPVIWYHSSTRFLFVDEGVYAETPNFLSIDFAARIWTLVDVDEDMIGVPSHLVVEGTRHLIIFITSPKSSRWKSLTKTTSPLVVIMNPWTIDEILQAAIIHGLDNKEGAIRDAYNLYGPTPRICLDYLSKEQVGLACHEAEIQAALRELSLDMLNKIVMALNSTDGGTNNLSHHIFLLERMTEDMIQEMNLKLDDIRKYTYGSIRPISRAVVEKLQNLFAMLSLTEHQMWYERFVNIPMGRISAGFLYESFVHKTFEEEIKLDLFPMKDQRVLVSGRQKLQWKSTHEDPSKQSSPIHTTPTNTIAYQESITTIEPEVYYILRARNQVGFNSFVMTNNTLYIFQASIASCHRINPGLLSFFSKVSEGSLPRDMPWKFVFVIPTLVQISCPQPTDSGLMDKLRSGMELVSAMCHFPVRPQA